MVGYIFFQAEDGIRDIGVTGVQTCALPISRPHRPAAAGRGRARRLPVRGDLMTLEQPDGRSPRPTRHRGPIVLRGGEPDAQTQGTTTDARLLDRRGPTDWVHTDRSEERRVGKEC